MARSEAQSHDSEQAVSAGEKHQTDHASPDAKRAKTERQTTLKEALGKEADKDDAKRTKTEKQANPDEALENRTDKDGAKDQAGKKEAPKAEKPKEDSSDAVQPSKETDVPSNILEKGIFYFFIRGRVGIDEPEKVDDIARSYILLRPIEKDAKLGRGPVGDGGTTRLLALPKKVLPSSGKDRFMVFVEKSSPSYDELKRTFLAAAEYETKTAGTRRTPAATPAGEGVPSSG
ncbi:hypothetical protein CDD83_4759 [Cordyceps sp. RAO-2017]|nr:hypothetical protein CDD83_4759 [Cordyceps sp. RAO-2017]